MLQQNSFHDLVYANRENIRKAGGTGLNLTAADCVIQLDPWCNPVAEDQADDRAHRIGQHCPLTIYRLITRGKIEEQTLELHQSNQDLPDSLPKGIDVNRDCLPKNCCSWSMVDQLLADSADRVNV
jgi:hypothetical protein